MVLIGEKRLGLDIWPKAKNQAKDRKNIMRRIQVTKAHYWQKEFETNSIAYSLSSKEARHVNLLTSYNKTIILLI